ncbi:MAG TPA: S41 family peptidase [Pyrinomonadaceae bacterium]|nr:S41 family peptidase [Pyrinomonadaceae bacterium]
MKLNLRPRTLPLSAARLLCVALIALALAGARPSRDASAQGLGTFDRESAQAMLDAVKDDLRKNYYDAGLRGIDLDARFKEAQEKLKQATTRDQLMIAIAQVLLDLNDSHTFFLPPFRAARVWYGWQMQMVGDACLVTNVNPNHDAAAKGLKPGDMVLSVDGYRPTRENLWKMYYRYYVLMPARSVRLVVQSPGETQPRQVEIMSKVEKTAEVAQYFTNIWQYNSELKFERDRFHELGEALIWRMPSFNDSPEHVDEMMNKVSKFKTLILDLRGNGGGYHVTLERLVSHFFDREVKIADMKLRKETKQAVAKPRGDKAFKGQLIVLVDAESGSAAEIFARVVQLEKRGTVLGDRTAGAVMTGRSFDHETGVGRVLYFGTNITVADLVMPDGKSLEHVGVQPDELALPKMEDIASGRDPVLARAAELAGAKLAPEKAGALFPAEWRK